MPDDLSLLKEPAFAAGLNDLDDLLTQSGKAFLIGDGCSKCMGLSLMAELTANTLASEKLSTTTKTSLSAIQGRFADANAANIEDYLRELVDLAATYAIWANSWWSSDCIHSRCKFCRDSYQEELPILISKGLADFVCSKCNRS